MVLDLEELRDLVVVARATGTFQTALVSTQVNEVYTNLDRFKAGASTNMIEQWTAGGYDTKVSTILGAVITLANTSPEVVQPAAVAFDLATFDATLAELSAARAQFVTSEISNQNNRAASTERSVIFNSVEEMSGWQGYVDHGATHLIHGLGAPFDFTPIERLLAEVRA